MADLSELIAASLAAKVALDAAGPEIDCEGPEWHAYELAEHLVLIHPCHSIDEVREKVTFYLDHDGPYDTLRNCYTETEEALLPFLRSLIGEVTV